MGAGLSRPQYSFSERLRPVEYFRRCDPSDCFCGTTHTRERNVAIQRLPGGQEVYTDPAEIMNGMLMGAGYGQPMMGMNYAMPPSYGYQPMMSGMPMMTTPNIMTTGFNPGLASGTTMTTNPASANWPAEWKDPSEWTVRDFNRLGEIMDEYLSRQRGRGFSMPQHNKSMVSPRMMQEETWTPPYMEMPHNRRRPYQPEFEELQAQMMKYVEDSKQQMQAMNDFLYGSERERREELYKDRQRKMIEDIVRNLVGPSRGADNLFPGMRPDTSAAMPGFAHAGMPPYMPYGSPSAGLMGGHPMGMMGGMSPFQSQMGMHPSMTGYNDLPPAGRRMPSRHQQRRPGIGFVEDFEEDYSRRRPRKQRFGFDDDPNDLFNLGGDDDRSPRGPTQPKQPRPDRDDGGGGGAYFADGRRARDDGPEPRTVRFSSPEVQDPRPEHDWRHPAENSRPRWPPTSPPALRSAISQPYTYTGSWPDASQAPGSSMGPGRAESAGDLPPYAAESYLRSPQSKASQQTAYPRVVMSDYEPSSSNDPNRPKEV